jgi:uncharacterized glyoxalase superfamily protein PhnB
MKVLEVYPYLRIRGASEAIAFYKQAFDAVELFRLTEPGGRVGHAELRFGDVTIMLSDEYPELGIQGPQTVGGTTFAMHLHVDSADACIEQAVNAGATVVRKAENQMHGERSGMIRDPFGHEWLIGEHIEDVSPEEMQRRFNAWVAK